MSSKSFFAGVGLSDFFNAMDKTDAFCQRNNSGVSWKGKPLFSGVFRLKVNTVDELPNLLGNLSKAPIFIATLPDQPAVGDNVFLSSNVDVIGAMLKHWVEFGERIFVLSPALALQSHDNNEGLLSSALEEIRRLACMYQQLGVVFILVDVDMKDGKSEARRCIHQYSDETLF